MWDVYSFGTDYYFLYVLYMKENRIFGISEYLKHVQKDLSNLMIL